MLREGGHNHSLQTHNQYYPKNPQNVNYLKCMEYIRYIKLLLVITTQRMLQVPLINI